MQNRKNSKERTERKGENNDTHGSKERHSTTNRRSNKRGEINSHYGEEETNPNRRNDPIIITKKKREQP